MNTLKVLFIALVMVVSFSACAPNHEDEVVPTSNDAELEQFEVKNEEGGDGSNKGVPTVPNP